jgi:hypothetical protein
MRLFCYTFVCLLFASLLVLLTQATAVRAIASMDKTTIAAQQVIDVHWKRQLRFCGCVLCGFGFDVFDFLLRPVHRHMIISQPCLRGLFW